MCAILALEGRVGSSVSKTPCACKNPHFSLSSIALMARETRLSKSAQEVAIIAILISWDESKIDALSNSKERRRPHGSSSKEGPGNFKDSSFSLTCEIDSPDNNSIPPSIDFSSS